MLFTKVRDFSAYRVKAQTRASISFAIISFKMTLKNEPKLESVINNLANCGYVVVDDFLPANIVENLNKLAKDHYAQNNMQAAKVGSKNKLQNNAIRGDSIVWLDENNENNQNNDIQVYFEKMHELKKAFNEYLFLNVHEIEAHFACYPVGSFYQKHLDQFSQVSGNQTRQLSSVLYLNKDWQASNGGELRLYSKDNEFIDILPNAGRLVLFLSAQFWHEVLPAKVERLSLTGWFRTRN